MFLDRVFIRISISDDIWTFLLLISFLILLGQKNTRYVKLVRFLLLNWFLLLIASNYKQEVEGLINISAIQVQTMYNVPIILVGAAVVLIAILKRCLTKTDMK